MRKLSVHQLVQQAGKAIGLALSLAVIVLNTLGSATPDASISMLAIGLFALALSTF